MSGGEPEGVIAIRREPSGFIVEGPEPARSVIAEYLADHPEFEREIALDSARMMGLQHPVGDVLMFDDPQLNVEWACPPEVRKVTLDRLREHPLPHLNRRDRREQRALQRRTRR